MAFDVNSRTDEPLQGAAWIESDAKRKFDRKLYRVGLAPSAVVSGIFCSIVFLGDRKSPFFKQTRVGKDGKEFDLYKIRSMDRTDYMDYTHTLDDPRITRVGKFMRKLALDESPQLFNIRKGHMSFVGPRPLRKHAIDEMREHLDRDEFEDWYEIYTLSRPGLASSFANLGRAEAMGATEIRSKERYKYDLQDFEQASRRNDFRLLLGAFSTVASNVIKS